LVHLASDFGQSLVNQNDVAAEQSRDMMLIDDLARFGVKGSSVKVYKMKMVVAVTVVDGCIGC
jgi:hypothetical protein